MYVLLHVIILHPRGDLVIRLDPCKIRHFYVTTPQIETILTDKTGTKWEVTSIAETEAGRAAEQNVTIENPDSTSYAKRRVYSKRSWDCVHFIVEKFIVRRYDS